MLGQRVITAIVLLAVLLPALFAATPWPFSAVTLVFIGAAGWEWGRLNGLHAAGSLILGAVVAAACVASLLGGASAQVPPWVWQLTLAAWVVGGALALRTGVDGWPHVPQALRLVIGVVALVVAWHGMAGARTLGVNFLLSVLCLVWCADIFAYFGGRAFGKRKLAPTISPGKSWAGVWSGMAAVLVLAAGWIALDTRGIGDSQSVYTVLLRAWGWIGLVVCVVFLAAISVVGDLFESLVKRAAGAKDSSALLPGHGGVLDRIDALLPVVPLSMALAVR